MLGARRYQYRRFPGRPSLGHAGPGVYSFGLQGRKKEDGMRVQGDHWVDEAGRRLVLRGVNAGGDCKIPVKPDGDTRLKEGFYDRRGASFVGRPFALDEADGHFARLKRWGLDFLRLLVTWEAVEHDGPGIYDEEYLDYVESLAAKAGEHGISFFVDPHQDVWSRWTGGDGAPMWTLEAAGFEPRRLFASGAALLNQEMGAAYPRMAWISNHDRLACATMWTLFFAGDDFAPGIGPLGFEGEGTSMQGFLQGHYAAAMSMVAARVARFPHVVGFDSLNEPSAGYIGLEDLGRRGSMMSLGATPTPWEGMLAGSGHPVEADVFAIRGLARKKVGTERLGAEGLRAWKDGVDCLWRRAGVWDVVGGGVAGSGERPVLKRPAHFATARGRRVDFAKDYLEPFIRRFDEAVCRAEGGARRFVLFVEGVPNAHRPTLAAAGEGSVVDATHWYDDLTLVTKRWLGFAAYDARHDRIVLGRGSVRRYFTEAMRELKSWSIENLGGAPTLLGEFGIPFDMNGAKAYRTGDYRLQERALSANYDAVDASLVDSTLWNYTAGNRHDRGDLWNTEDLSIFCRDESEAGRSETENPADAGGRALRGFVRPYARATAGEILEMRFDSRRGIFLLRYRPDPAIAAPTEVFLPALQFPRGFAIEAVGCEAEAAEETLLLKARPGAAEAVLRIRRR
jgi:hypothetical protein